MKAKNKRILSLIDSIARGMIVRRTCYSMHHCFICDKTIEYGVSYYDGGYNRRAHEVCVIHETVIYRKESKQCSSSK
jgi:hypothetical protein